MSNVEDKKSKTLKGPRRVYLSKARILAEEELGSLSEKEKAYAAQCKDRGIWLELFCPDDACLTEQEQMKVPVFCENKDHDHSLFVDLFCPDGTCEPTEPTDIP